MNSMVFHLPVVMCMSDHRWGLDWFGFIEHLEFATITNNNDSRIYTVYNLLWHALNLLSLLCLHRASGNVFQHRMFRFLWVSELSPYLSHSNYLIAPIELLLSHEDFF
jgi:hypothetical protein